MAGLGLAGFFTALTWWTGQPYWDALGSIGVGLLMGAIALQLMRTNKRFLIGEVAACRQLCWRRGLLVRAHTGHVQCTNQHTPPCHESWLYETADESVMGPLMLPDRLSLPGLVQPTPARASLAFHLAVHGPGP